MATFRDVFVISGIRGGNSSQYYCWTCLAQSADAAFLFTGNLLVPRDAVGVASTPEIGNRVGVATLLMLISLVGSRIIARFTRNWLIKERLEISAPATFSMR